MAVFPSSSLPGLAWSTFKVPQFKTKIQTSVAKRELRLSFQPTPTWEFTLKFAFLRDANDQRQTTPPGWGTSLQELRTLMGFFMSMQGALTPFLYDDPTDDNVVGQNIGTGNGTQTAFQLVRTMGGVSGSFNEPIIAPNTVSAIFDNGVLVSPSNYSVNLGTGVVTFNTAPLSGHAITANFSYYFLVRFSDDTAEFENFLYQLWSANKIKFQSVLL